MQPLEIPYNYDLELLEFLKIYFKNELPMLHCIYLPPFQEDYISAKYYDSYSGDYNKKYCDLLPKTREEYLIHINKINEYFPNKIMLLLQQPNQIIQNLEFYLSLNISNFCVGNIKQAQIIKSYNKFYNITGSITMQIDKEKMQQYYEDYYEYFNNFVLPFKYYRDIYSILELPQAFNYILILNEGCSIFCDGLHHWFTKSKEEEIEAINNCPLKDPKNCTFQNTAWIRPIDIPIFDSFISYYKLQGRSFDTKLLIKDIVRYTSSYNGLRFYGYKKMPSLYYKNI